MDNGYEKYASKPNEEFKKIIENQKIVHKLINRNFKFYLHFF